MAHPVKVIAVLCGLLALGLRVWQTLWLWPRTGALLWAVTLIAGLAAPLALFWVVTKRFSRRDRRIIIDRRRRQFIVPASARFTGVVSILIMAYAGSCAVAGGQALLTVVALFTFIALALWVLFAEPVSLILDPQGVRTKQFWLSDEMLWEGVDSVAPSRWGITLRGRPPVSREVGVPLRLLQADPKWLRAVIHEYVARAERRTAIGTESEWLRLAGDVKTPRAHDE